MTLSKKNHIWCIVNGKRREIDVSSKQTLLDILRNEFGLTGAKKGCGIGICGTCTVIMDRKAVRSCVIPSTHIEGKEIITIEGLSTQDTLHPIQQAFVNHHAVQCGYCTPGMILSAKAFLDSNPNPTREQIQQALTGNLCRCTGYQQIIDAILDVARFESDARDKVQVKEQTHIIGTSVPRVDIIDKVTGRTKYIADLTIYELHQAGIKADSMLHARILRSLHSHARILNIDITQAKQIDGVVTILTAADVPGSKLYGKAVSDQPVLAFDKVRYFGEPVALIIAESENIAESAINRIKVDYELLPAIFNPMDAMKPESPKLHDADIYTELLPHSEEVHTKNILYHFSIQKVILLLDLHKQTG